MQLNKATGWFKLSLSAYNSLDNIYQVSLVLQCIAYPFSIRTLWDYMK